MSPIMSPQSCEEIGGGTDWGSLSEGPEFSWLADSLQGLVREPTPTVSIERTLVSVRRGYGDQTEHNLLA